MKRIFFTMLIAVSMILAGSIFNSCGRNSNPINPNTGPKDDFDNDGLINEVDPDDDNDGCPDGQDPNQFNANIGCDGDDDDDDDDDDDNINPECKTEENGDWVILSDYGEFGEEDPDNTSEDHANPFDLEDCIETKTHDKYVIINIDYCAHWRDVVKLQGDVLSIQSFTNVQSGYIGSFASLHPLCGSWAGSKYVSKAYVKVYESDETCRCVDGSCSNKGTKIKDFTWNQPAFSPINLSINNMDRETSSQVHDWEQFAGRANMAYTNVNNNFGKGQRTHLFKIDDWRWGPNRYAFEFCYGYDVKESGYYGKKQPE